MAQPAWLNKYLTMKPEVTKIFDDLEAWHDHCRLELINFNPADMYKSDVYRDWNRRKNSKPRHFKNDFNRNNNYKKPYRQ